MRTLRRSCLLLVLACLTAAAQTPEQEDVRRFAGILDYIAGDYAGAVRDGKVIDASEYAEQGAFLADAAILAAKLPPAGVNVAAGVAVLHRMFDDKADPAALAAAARSLRRGVLDAHHIVLAPTAPPSLARARDLYATNCASCHGTGGRGDGPAGAALKPPPRSFVDPEVMKDLSPARAFNGLTDGIRGTAMPSWGGLSTGDRWSLAFYVFTLRHRGASPAAAPPPGAPRDTAALASLSDGEIDALLTAQDPAARAAALAYLRVIAPFATDARPLDAALRHLARATTAYQAGDRATASTEVGVAYLDGFEPLEGALRARDGELVAHVEERFLALRSGMGSGAPADKLEQEALQLGALLDRAEETLAGRGGAGVAFVGAMVVILREGVEAALLIMLLLGMARRTATEDTAGDARAVHAGWLVASALGLLTWFASEPIVRLGGASRELIEGIVAVVAAAVLLATGHFVLARIDAQHRVQAIKRRLAAAGGRRRMVFAGLAFVAVYREAFEVVLFLRAIAFDGQVSGLAILGGVGAGAVLLIGVVAMLLKLGRRLKPGPLLATMGTVLCVLAVVLAGKGVRALQEAGVLSIHPLDLPRLEWLGVFPSLQGILAQVAVLTAFLLIAVTALRTRSYKGASA